MWRTAFLTVWLGCLGYVASCWMPGPGELPPQGEALTVLSLLIVVLPWAAGAGLLPVLGRMDRGGINLPHADYWFTGPRRAASLEKLAPFLHALGLMLTLFLTGLLALEVQHAQQGQTLPEEEVLLATGGFLLLVSLWVMVLMRAFPAPPHTTAPTPAPTRRGQP